MQRFLLPASLVAAFVLVQAPLEGQAPTWTQATATGPSARGCHAMAYDLQRGCTVLFGGAISSTSSSGQTWKWDGATWTLITGPGPSARYNSAMCYDLQRGCCVLFGGRTHSGTNYGDTWEYDGSGWTQRNVTGPAARNSHAMAYDSVRGVTVLYGGYSPTGGGYVRDTWEWNGATWTRRAISGPPSASANTSLAYDSQRQRTVLFGGHNNGVGYRDTGEWDGTTWAFGSSAGPSARAAQSMAYDELANVTVLFGGLNTSTSSRLNDTWTWDGTSWTQVPIPGPSSRAFCPMAYDSQRQRTVLFGGEWSNWAFRSDTWELTFPNPNAATFTNYGAGCPGTTSTFSYCAQANPAGGTLVGGTASREYGILVSGGPMQVLSVDVFTQSTGGTQTVPVHVYPFSTTPVPPLASTTMTVDSSPGFYSATFPAPVTVNGNFFLAVDVSAQTVVAPHLTTGTTTAVFERTTPGAGAWSFSMTVTCPAWRVSCTAGTQYLVPSLGNNGLPVIGTTYAVTLDDALANSAAIFMTGLSNQSSSLFGPLPYSPPNAPGCSLLVDPGLTVVYLTSGSGTASHSISLPNAPSYIGLHLYHQWAVLDFANPLGIVVSDAGDAKVGT